MKSSTNLDPNRILTIAVIALGILAILLGISVLPARQSTGTLHITTFADDAAISISQDNKNALKVGSGSVKLRLKPGAYEVVAANDSKIAHKQVVIHKQQTTELDLRSVRPEIASPDDIKFTNIDRFPYLGLSEEQVTTLRTLFFYYKPRAVQVAIDRTSIKNGERLDFNAPFTLTFTGNVDGQKYKAVITYDVTDDTNLRLTLYNPTTGAQLFDQDSTPSSPA